MRRKVRRGANGNTDAKPEADEEPYEVEEEEEAEEEEEEAEEEEGGEEEEHGGKKKRRRGWKRELQQHRGRLYLRLQ